MKLAPAVRTLLIAAMLHLLLPFSGALAAETLLKTGNDQPLAATLSFSTAPLKSMTAIPFTLTVDDGSKEIHSAACELTMPAMAMPSNQPDLICSGTSCTGTAIFTMAGAWQVTFGLILKDGTHTSLLFDIEMVTMK